MNQVIHYPNLRSFMKRHQITIKDLAKILNKSYPTVHQKITRKKTKHGKVSLFDIEEAGTIISFVIHTEQEYLKQKFGDKWEEEWNLRWGHIHDWLKYLFFDELVTNATIKSA